LFVVFVLCDAGLILARRMQHTQVHYYDCTRQKSPVLYGVAFCLGKGFNTVGLFTYITHVPTMD